MLIASISGEKVADETDGSVLEVCWFGDTAEMKHNIRGDATMLLYLVGRRHVDRESI
jgi:hypothetical protein